MSKTEAGFAGADWVAANFKCQMSPLGRVVADLLGDIYEGIYHLDDSALIKVDWSNEYTISIVLRAEFSTVDHNGLTRLVVLCHDRMLRCSIRARTVNYLELRFHQRELREGGHFAQRCPTLEDHVRMIRDHYKPLGH